MARHAPTATLIGDVVASRATGDRRRLHRALLGALDEVNGAMEPSVPLRVTIGDEYQGCFATVGQALRATLRLHLALHAMADVRHGVGWGSVTVLSKEPRVEDGPGWWAARAAVESVHDAQSRASTRSCRTAYRLAEDVTGPDPAAVNAALLLRDEALAGLADASVSVLSGMLSGMSQQQVADELGVSASAVSQRIRRDGLAALARADELLGGVS